MALCATGLEARLETTVCSRLVSQYVLFSIYYFLNMFARLTFGKRHENKIRCGMRSVAHLFSDGAGTQGGRRKEERAASARILETAG